MKGLICVALLCSSLRSGREDIFFSQVRDGRVPVQSCPE